MELQIQDLISEIKKDGIEEANKKGQAIIDNAKREAAKIISDAKLEAESLLTSSTNKIETLKNGAMESIDQKRRDAVILFKDAIKEELNKILMADVKKVVKGDTLSNLIIAALNNEDPGKYTVEVSEITDGLKAALKKEVSEGLDIKLSNKEKTGFRLSLKDGSGYFDLSDEEINELLKPLFSSLDI